jgi:Na+/melibiose symporter-like transporter
VVLLAFAAGTWTGSINWVALLVTWVFLGIGYSAVQTPTGRLLRRSAQAEDRPALFAAQFALSHACWLVTYPLAGWLGAAAGIPMTLAVLGLVTLLGFVLAARLWPADDPEEIEHVHPDLPSDHPHLRQHHGRAHAHAFTIDDLHRRWPAKQATGQGPSPVSGRT